MRAFEGQKSDSVPTARSRDQEARLLGELRQARAAMRPTTAAALRASLDARIAGLAARLEPPAAPARLAPPRR